MMSKKNSNNPDKMKKRLQDCLKEINDAGWEIKGAFDDDLLPPDGPVMYICDVMSGTLILLAFAMKIEDVIKKIPLPPGTNYQDVCNCLGSFLQDHLEGKACIDTPEGSSALHACAAHYIIGTKSYQTISKLDARRQQYIILRYYDASSHQFLLRPSPIIHAHVLDVAKIEGFANAILEHDQITHPERFNNASVMRYGFQGVNHQRH